MSKMTPKTAGALITQHFGYITPAESDAILSAWEADCTSRDYYVVEMRLAEERAEKAEARIKALDAIARAERSHSMSVEDDLLTAQAHIEVLENLWRRQLADETARQWMQCGLIREVEAALAAEEKKPQDSRTCGSSFATVKDGPNQASIDAACQAYRPPPSPKRRRGMNKRSDTREVTEVYTRTGVLLIPDSLFMANRVVGDLCDALTREIADHEADRKRLEVVDWENANQRTRIEALETERLDNGSLIVQCEDMKARILRLRERLSRHECTECGLETGHAAGCSSALAKGER